MFGFQNTGPWPLPGKTQRIAESRGLFDGHLHSIERIAVSVDGQCTLNGPAHMDDLERFLLLVPSNWTDFTGTFAMHFSSSSSRNFQGVPL